MATINLDDPEAMAKVQEFANLAERGLKQNLAARHPDLCRVDPETDLRNAEAIDRIFPEQTRSGNWKFSDESYEAAYAVALQSGQLTLPAPGTIEDGNGVYPTAGVPRLDTSGRLIYPVATEEEFLCTAPLPKVGEYLKQKLEAPRPPNMWEQFPTAGERTPRHEGGVLDAEASEALRQKIVQGMR